MFPNIPWGWAGGQNHPSLRAIYYKSPWWLKSVLDFFFLSSFCGLSVCAQSMEIKAYCALELNNSFFLACVVWDKLPNFWVSIPFSVWDV